VFSTSVREAACAAEAHALQESWQIRPAPGSAAEEARLFAAWRREFQRRTAARGWLESTRAMTAAIELVEAGQVPLPEAVCFAGFDRATPQETRLREALAARGVRELPWNPPAVADAALRRREFPDLAAECRAVAAWAAAHLAARPEARLGIVAPDLAAVRQPLAAGLDDALHPESLRPAAAEAPRRYNFSLGEPLAGEPLVRTALALLALATRPRHEQSVFSALLLDPAWSAGLAEADSRARIDAALRRELEYFTDLPALLRLMKRLFARDGIAAPRLKAHLEAFAAALAAGLVARYRGVSRAEAWRRIWRGETAFAWNAVLLALGGLLLTLFPLFSLAASYHVFGTDKVGQDVLYQVLKSVRTGLIIGLVTTLVMLPMAVLLGIVAGYFRGWADDVIQYVYTVLNSIPGVLLIAAAVLMMQVVIDTHPQWFSTAAERADLRLLALCFILGITSWTGLCRLLRGETLKLRELEYIQAARAFGVSHRRIILRHILPNLMHIVIIALVMDFSGLVLAEAVLSYVGIGVDPTMVSFGTMINNARMELGREPVVWWSLAAAFAAMFILVLAANLFADAVRDAFDPRAA